MSAKGEALLKRMQDYREYYLFCKGRPPERVLLEADQHALALKELGKSEFLGMRLDALPKRRD